MKRILLAGIALAVTVTVQIPTADAQVSNGRNPWCLRDGPLGRGTWDCTYHNYKQCYDFQRLRFRRIVRPEPQLSRRAPGLPAKRPQGAPQGTWGWGGGRY